MLVRPPDLRRQPERVLVRRHGAREEQRLAERDGDGLQPLLLGLGPEVAEVRRREHAGDDLHALVLEGVDLRRVVAAAEREAARIDDGEALLLQRGREADVGIAPGVAVGIVGPQAADDGPRLEVAPHAGEDLDDVLEAPEEVVVPRRGQRRLDVRTELPADAEVVRLPRRVVRQHRDLVVGGLLHDGDGGVRRLRDEQHVHALVGDELLRGGGRGVGVRLRVAVDDVDLVALALDHQAVGEQLAQPAEHEGVGLTERRQRTGLGRDVAELDGAVAAAPAGQATTTAAGAGRGAGRGLRAAPGRRVRAAGRGVRRRPTVVAPAPRQEGGATDAERRGRAEELPA